MDGSGNRPATPKCLFASLLLLSSSIFFRCRHHHLRHHHHYINVIVVIVIALLIISIIPKCLHCWSLLLLSIAVIITVAIIALLTISIMIFLVLTQLEYVPPTEERISGTGHIIILTMTMTMTITLTTQIFIIMVTPKNHGHTVKSLYIALAGTKEITHGPRASH